MLNFNLFSFILNHFLSNRLPCVVIFNCWNRETLSTFSGLASESSIYSLYVSLNDTSTLNHFSSRHMRHDRPEIGIFMDMNCNQTDNFIKENSRQRLFNYRYNWLIYDELSNFSRFYNIFKHVNLSVDTQVTYVVPKEPQTSVTKNRTSFITFDVYNNGFNLGGTINITSNFETECNRSKCEKTKYLSELYKRSKYGNRESLRDITMRAALVVTRYDINAPREEIHNFLIAQKDFHIDPLSRLGMLIFRLLIDCLYTNVSYVYHDHWTDVDYVGGVVGELVNETADFVTCPFFMTPGRFRFLSPIAITGTFGMVCMFRTPRNSGLQGHVFLVPFSTKVWIYFAIILMIFAIFLWLTFSVEYHRMKPYIDFVPSLLTTLLISFGSACAQSSFLVPGSIGGRLGFISLSIICFLMYNYYTSIVVSSLLGSPVKSKLKTLKDLTESELEVGLEAWPYMYTYLNYSTLPDIRRFVKRKMENKKLTHSPYYSSQEGITKIRTKPGFVFIFETSTGYNMIENQFSPEEICDLNKIQFRPDHMLASHLHRNSSYKEIARLKLVRILESGVHSKHRRLWVRTNLNCLANNILVNVGMEYAAPLFLMLLFSYLAVLLIFAIENVWFCYFVNRRNMTIIERC